ncbi:hypothetical protein CROQUDRAFT_98626 [Cronartium quercuum f. sp. fusiforme G11]|uniref:Uncharacterized protein n=1 Tax=Cronartium quercuum f. sp. fusiforme G11 TaxID=708437 RepID=A0A9P6T755_9BASI|nr:hypothetical protein CROQUDRAFT_98626 [Cronartium quercuum f. sp. fusiforme G11]
MTALHKIHSATLAFLIKEFISSKGPEYDLSQPDVAEKLINKVYDKYFTGESICNAKAAQDGALYNLLLRL